MSGRTYQRWTPQRLEKCRALYEGGMKAAEIGVKFGVSGSTVSVMAWQKKWQRKVKVTATVPVLVPVAASADEGAAAMMVDAREEAFNRKLCDTIREYWRERGCAIELQLMPQGEGLLGMRSKSVNGVPVKR